MMRVSADSTSGLRPPLVNDTSTSPCGSCTLRGFPGWFRWSETTFLKQGEKSVRVRVEFRF